MKTTTKKTSSKKSTKPAPTNKIVIRDACATAFCEKEPVAGSSYCAEHKPLAAIAEKKLEALLTAQEKKNAAAVAAFVAQQAKVEAKKPKAKRAAKAPEVSEAAEVVAALLAKGWTFATIGQGLGGLNPGYAKAWAAGKGCRRLPELRALLALDKPVAAAPKASKGVSGSLRAPSAKAAKAAALRFEDPRQLFLDLRNALDAVLTATK